MNCLQLSKKSVKKLRNILLEITPELTAIMDEFKTLGNMRIKPAEGESVDAAKAAETGVNMIKEAFDMILNRQYERIIKVLAAVSESSVEEIEEKTFEELLEMVSEILRDENILRFFPRFKSLGRTMSADILPK